MRHAIPWRRAAGVLAAAAGAWLLAAIPPAPGATASTKSIDDYRLLTDRNIFVRNRRAPVTPSGPIKAPPPPDPDSGIVLTGVARSADRYVAFFEMPSGSTAWVGAGERIGKGTIKALTLNAVEYEREGRVQTVTVGHSLLGAARAWPKVVRTPTSMPAVAATTAPAEPSGRPEMPGMPGMPAMPGPGGEFASGDGPPPGPPPGPEEPSDTTPAAGPSGNAGNQDSAISIEEQMRRRRERELGR